MEIFSRRIYLLLRSTIASIDWGSSQTNLDNSQLQTSSPDVTVRASGLRGTIIGTSTASEAHVRKLPLRPVYTRQVRWKRLSSYPKFGAVHNVIDMGARLRPVLNGIHLNLVCRWWQPRGETDQILNGSKKSTETFSLQYRETEVIFS